AEIIAVRPAPVVEAAVAFALFVSKGGIDLAEAAISHLGGFDDAARLAAPIEHEPALARGRCIRLVLGAACRGLDAPEGEIEQFVGRLRPVAERERPEAAIFFRDGAYIHELRPPASVGTSSGLKP